MIFSLALVKNTQIFEVSKFSKLDISQFSTFLDASRSLDIFRHFSTILDVSRHFSTFLEISRHVEFCREMSKSVVGGGTFTGTMLNFN